jgi:hypothetical protein
MPIYYQSQLEEIALTHQGIRVDRAAARILTTPGTTLFTVTGGNVMMTGFYGEVIVVQGAGATTLSLVHTPTAGTASTIASGVTDIAAAAAGMCLQLPAALAGGMTLTATAYGRIQNRCRYILRPGVMSVFGSASPTGSIRWTMWYVPVDYGAYVTGG